MGAECLVHQTTGHGVTVLQQRLLLVKMQQNQLRTGPAIVYQEIDRVLLPILPS